MDDPVKQVIRDADGGLTLVNGAETMRVPPPAEGVPVADVDMFTIVDEFMALNQGAFVKWISGAFSWFRGN